MQRVKDLSNALKWIEKQDITKYNLHSLSTAKLSTVVLGAVAGKKAKSTVEDFLPFDPRKIKSETGVSDESLAVLRKLMRTKKMSGTLLGMLAEELKNYSSR